jgi:carbon monoxide dehydrogenase subunit G
MTRAISLHKPPEVVWPWLAQIGRGAGWYSYDRLDNGGKASARHLVAWIPEPQLGDATAIGYLRHLEPGRELVWWVSGEQFLGSSARLVFDILVTPEDGGSRLVIRVSADAAGPTARLALGVFQLMDTIMARRQLLGIKERVETYGARTVDSDHPENGRPDQYQLGVVIYASGQMAGVQGQEKISRWRQMAIEDKVIVDKGSS